MGCKNRELPYCGFQKEDKIAVTPKQEFAKIRKRVAFSSDLLDICRESTQLRSDTVCSNSVASDR